MFRTASTRVWLLSAVVAVCIAVSSPSAHAQTTLVGGLGGVAGFGTTCLSPNDDGSSNMIALAPAFPSGLRFFDRTHTAMFVNTNGNITFGAALPVYTPNAFPVANQPMIAPYWADVDIRSGSTCTSIPVGTSPGYLACRNPTENGVWWNLTPGRVVVTWHRVGYYNCHQNLRMNFQLILTAAPACGGAGDFDVEFRYNQCQWTTGDASGGTGGLGGTEAQAGFDAGNTRDFVEIRNSRTPTIHTTLCTMSNVAMPGIWRFQIRRGTVMCPDAGRACVTGMMGICNEGATQCVGTGTRCVGLVTASPERCDGVDNDCNGMTDDGAMCPVGERCVRGVCTGECVEGSCFDGYTCSMGQCIETACVGVTCMAGQRCIGGRCQAACDGVVCPAGQTCRAGRCIDPCAGLMCAAMLVCEDGVCVDQCGGCRACPTGRTCQTTTGRCVESACATMTCGAGTVCRAGACVDPCMGAVCPRGERCEMGNCVTIPVEPPDAGMGLPDAGTSEQDSGTVPDTDAATTVPDAARGDARSDARSGDGGLGGGMNGCGCRTMSGRTGMPAGLLAMGAMAMFAAMRRRRRSR